MDNKLKFTVNGAQVEEDGVSPTTTLLNYLRGNLGLTGTKEGCAEGDCGACTVAIIDPDAPGGPTFRAVNACLVLLPMVQNKTIVTVEGLREGRGAYHPVQQSLVENLGSQCGYCTPGVIMSMFEAHYRKDLDEAWKLDDQMCGNLCRCTGYRPIMDATRATAGKASADRFTDALAEATSEPMALSYTHSGQRFHTPGDFDALWDVLDANADARLVVGGTDLSLEITKQFKTPPCLVSLEGIAELSRLTREADHWWIGAGVWLSVLESAARPDFPAIERMLRFFGARQIKNRATLGGNLCTASPIGDMAPVLISLDATAIIRGRAGRREVSMEAFFTGYRTTALQPGEILEAVKVPSTPGAPSDVRTAAYKVSKRQELDISTVSAGMAVHLDPEGRVTQARLAFGGMAARPARASKAEAALVGQLWDEAAVERAASLIARDFTPIDDHRGSAWYRGTVAGNLLRGFYLETRGAPSPRLPYRPTGTVNPEVIP